MEANMDFGRVITAMITPMHNDFSVDYDGAQKLAAHLYDNGSDALVITGTTGESPTLCQEEKLKMYAAVREVAVSKGKKIIAGTSGSDTAAAVELSKKAEALGVDALLTVVPPYNKPPQQGLYQHFAALASAVSVPIMLYNVPGRTVANLLPETVARLAEIPNIVAIKEASGNLEQVMRIRMLTPADFLIYSGEDMLTLPLLSIGSSGIVSVAAHLVGTGMQEMITAFEQGKNELAIELHYRYADVFRLLFLCANPIPLKYCLNRIGLPAGPCRLPLCEPEEAIQLQLDKMLQHVGLL
jgi:4-hydroxy-tetrahydrodipicolinate synthase